MDGWMDGGREGGMEGWMDRGRGGPHHFGLAGNR